MLAGLKFERKILDQCKKCVFKQFQECVKQYQEFCSLYRTLLLLLGDDIYHMIPYTVPQIVLILQMKQ